MIRTIDNPKDHWFSPHYLLNLIPLCDSNQQLYQFNLSKPQIMEEDKKKKIKKKIIIWLNCKNEWSPGYFKQQVLILLIVNTGCSHIYLLPLYIAG